MKSPLMTKADRQQTCRVVFVLLAVIAGIWLVSAYAKQPITTTENHHVKR